MTIRFCLLILFLFAGSTLASSDKLKESISAETKGLISGFLGDKIQFSFLVEVNKKVDPVKTTTEKNKNFDGYLPRPMVSPDIFNPVDYTVKIKVYVFSEVENIEELRKILQTGLSQYRPAIYLNIVHGAISKKEEPKKEELPKKKIVSPPKELSTWEKIISSPEHILKLVFIVSALLVFLASFLFLLLNLKSMVKSISDSIKDGKKVTETKNDKQDYHNNPLKDNVDFEIASLEETIIQDPIIFSDILDHSAPNDIAGFKAILSLIGQKSQLQLKGQLRPEFLSEVSVSTLNPLSGMELKLWLNRLLERIGLKRLLTDGYYEKIIGQERWAKLKALKGKELRAIAAKLNSSLGYKVIMDLLAPDERKILVSEMKGEEWGLLLSERFNDSNQISSIADTILSQDLVDDSVFDLPPCILLSAVDMVKSADFEQEDELIKSIFGDNQEMLGEFYKLYLPVSQLQSLDAGVVKSAFLATSNQLKAQILSVLPSQQYKFLSDFITEGKAKVIILDSASKLAKSDEKIILESRMVAKDFIQKVNKVSNTKSKSKPLKLVA